MSELNEEKERGFLGGIIETIKSTFDERLKSPFVGSFLISWFYMNWPGLIFLAKSEWDIEARIEYVRFKYFNIENSLFYPLLYSFLFILIFYVLNLLFLLVAESYVCARKYVERKFDKVSWRSPSEYISMKSGFLDKLREMTDLAADNIAKIDAEKGSHEQTKSLLNSANADRIGLNESIANLNRQLIDSTSKESELISDLNICLKSSADHIGKMERISASVSKLVSNSRLLFGDLFTSRQSGRTGDTLVGSISLFEYSKHMGALLDIIIGWRGALLKEPLSDLALRSYCEHKLPGLPIDDDDIERVYVIMASTREFKSVMSVDTAVEDASAFLSRLEIARPSLFCSSVDYVAIGAGLTNPEFRSKYPFPEALLQILRSNTRQ